MSSDRLGTNSAAECRRTSGRWYQFSLSSLLYVMLLIGVGAAGLHALRKESALDALRQQLADTAAALKASQAEAAAKEALAKSLRGEVAQADQRGMQRLRESEQLQAILNDVQRDPTRWLMHEEQQLVRRLRRLRATGQPAAEAARLRDEFRAKDRTVRQKFLYQLDLRFNFHRTGGLDDIVSYLSSEAKVPIVVNVDDLAEVQVPRIRYVKVHCDNATVEQALSQAIVWANPHFVRSLEDPRLELVYVLSEPDQAEPARLIVTTRKRAAQRGWLPESFVVRPGAPE
jgi:hypothetical protein